MKENRYEVVYCDDLSEEQYPGPRSPESFFAIVDTLDGTVFETDRMEPEDASFCRDLSWVPDIMNRHDREVSRIQRARAKLLVFKVNGYAALDERRHIRAVHFEDREKQAFYGTRAGHRLEKASRIAAKYLGEKP